MNRAQSNHRESIESRPSPPRRVGVSILDRSASGGNWTHSDLAHTNSGPNSGQVSLGDLRERADRARAACYMEGCRQRALIPLLRRLMEEAMEISATLRVERMRHRVLAVEVKRSLAIGRELHEAVSRRGQLRPKPHGILLQ